MQRVVLLLALFVITIVASRRGGIPTKTCDVTSLSELVDLQTKVDYARIACEGGLFNGFECSRYWMLNNDLIRKKLSFAWCKADKRETFRNWAGTSTTNGVIQNDFLSTLEKELEAFQSLHSLLTEEHNATLSLALKEAAETMQQLVNKVNEEVEKILNNIHSEASNVRSVDSLQESETRAFVSLKGEEERELTVEEETNTRETEEREASDVRATFSTLAEELRVLDQSEESDTREYQEARQEETREIIRNAEEREREESASESAASNNHFLLHTDAARARATSELYTTSESTRNKASSEESTTRTAVSLSEAQNVAADAAEEEQTRTEIAVAHENDAYATMTAVSHKEEATVTNFTGSTAILQNQFSEEANNSQSVWTDAASSIFSLLSVLEDGIGAAFEPLVIHFDLFQSFQRNMPVVNTYTENLVNFNKLRAVVNETLNYNRNAYGTNTNNIRTAVSKFNSAEQELKKTKPDYRVAVLYYSSAYVYSVTPTTSNSD